MSDSDSTKKKRELPHIIVPPAKLDLEPFEVASESLEPVACIPGCYVA
jgi:hypothetical protein